jgi:hypothetical protein
MAQREISPLALIERMKERRRTVCRAFGSSAIRPLRVHVLADPACAKIIPDLNQLDSYVSLKMQQTGQWKLSMSLPRSAKVLLATKIPIRKPKHFRWLPSEANWARDFRASVQTGAIVRKSAQLNETNGDLGQW